MPAPTYAPTFCVIMLGPLGSQHPFVYSETLAHRGSEQDRLGRIAAATSAEESQGIEAGLRAGQQAQKGKVGAGEPAVAADDTLQRSKVLQQDRTKAQSERSGERTGAKDARGLSEEEQKEVTRLRLRDAEVRAHEQAHVAAAGGLAQGAIRYTFVSGPDGRRYAVDGEVSLDTSPGNSPEESIQKAQRIRAAALAPAQPSAADLAVAAKALRMQLEAQNALREVQLDPQTEAEVEAGGGSEGKGEVAEASMGYPVYNSTSATTEDAAAQNTQAQHKGEPQGHHAHEPEHLANCPECLAKAFQKAQQLS